MHDPLDIAVNATGEWLSGHGPESDIVMSTRIRLARNVFEYPFLTRIEEKQKADLERFLREKLSKARLGQEVLYKNLTETTPLDRICLVERHLISRDHAQGEGGRGVAVASNETLSVMVNEEDHLRIQVLRSGLQLDAAWEQISKVDRSLEGDLNFAFSPQFGYLTACPTNVGTGMRVSVMLHLPALVMTKQIEKVFHAVTKINLAVRGFYGEGTQASGDFYQISNQITLGRSEEDILKIMVDHVPQIVAYERNTREKLVAENRVGLEDRVWRAFALLERSRLITSEETMDYLSAVRMGVNLGLIDKIPIQAVNELFILTQPAHLQKLHSRELETPERDELRARFVRQKLSDLN
ncbi:MAG TPA: protein arginine kinase [Planctomycetota bacterium]|nr:protein arginine kinase [Planctomycetota bacterium]